MAEPNKDSAARERRLRGAPREREAGGGGSAGRGPALVGFCRRPARRDGEGAPQPETRAEVAGPHPDAEGEAEVPWNCQQRREERGGTGEQQRDAGAAGGQRQ